MVISTAICEDCKGGRASSQKVFVNAIQTNEGFSKVEDVL